MNAAIICFSDAGAELAVRLAQEIGACIHSTDKYAEKYGFTAHKSIMADTGEMFSAYKALIFIGSCGIAVRCIAPHVKNKTIDPAVIVIDDGGHYVIPVLSGHIGGANALAGSIAAFLGAVPVITTATDVHGRFACDEWAAKHDCVISSMKLAKEVSAAILTEDIPVSADGGLPDNLPAGLVKAESGRLGIYIGIRTVQPYKNTLALIPRIIIVGVGCRRGTSKEAVISAVKTALAANDIDIRAVKAFASIDIKRNEEGLLSAAEELRVPIAFYSADELNSVAGEFTESEFVKKTTGTGNVCERAAAYGGGTIISRKSAQDGVTTALALDKWEILF